MSPFLFALALMFATPDTVVATAEAAPSAEEPRYPSGAPRDDYGLVAWCYGALSGYLSLHDQVMPEVTRIESAFRRPGTSLKDDLAAYETARRAGETDLKVFAKAMEAAEKASLRPLNAVGAQAMNQGRATWALASQTPKARLAQEWMSWALPAVCEPTATRLASNAVLMGAAFQTNAPAEAASADAAPAEAAPVESAPTPESENLDVAQPTAEPTQP